MFRLRLDLAILDHIIKLIELLQIQEPSMDCLVVLQEDMLTIES